MAIRKSRQLSAVLGNPADVKVCQWIIYIVAFCNIFTLHQPVEELLFMLPSTTFYLPTLDSPRKKLWVLF